MDSSEITFKNVTVILLISVINFLIVGSVKLSSIVYVACLDQYGVSRKEASLPFLIVPTLRTLVGPLTGILGKKFGPRLVVIWGCVCCFIGMGCCYFANGMLIVNIFWGGLQGLGCGLSLSLFPQIVGEHFKNNADKAYGVVSSCERLPTFVMPYLFVYLMNKYNLSGAFLITAALISHTIPVSMLLRLLTPTIISKQKPAANSLNCELNKHEKCTYVENTCEVIHPESKINSFQNKNVFEVKILNENEMKSIISEVNEQCSKIEITHTNKSFFKSLTILFDKVFIVIVITQSFLAFQIVAVYTTLVDLFRDANLPLHLEVYPIIVFTAADFIGCSLTGFITDGKCLSRVNLYAMNNIFLGVCLITVARLNQISWLFVVIFINGLFFGSSYIIAPGIVVDFVEKEDLSVAIASRLFLSAPLLLLLSPMIGFFREQHGSYGGLYYFLGATAFFCSILTFLIPVLGRQKKKTKQANETAAVK